MASVTTERFEQRDRFYEDDLHSTESPRSLTDLIRELRDESMTLLRQEAELAKTEISEKASRVGRNTGYLAAGGLIAFAGLLFLLVAATAGLYVGLVAAGLSHMTSGWLAPLIVGLVVAIIGYALVQKAISTLRNEPVMPERTAESLREDKDWIERKVN